MNSIARIGLPGDNMQRVADASKPINDAMRSFGQHANGQTKWIVPHNVWQQEQTKSIRG